MEGVACGRHGLSKHRHGSHVMQHHSNTCFPRKAAKLDLKNIKLVSDDGIVGKRDEKIPRKNVKRCELKHLLLTFG